ncbi:MAG: response regulator transcription factor [Microcoleus sp. PH2017_10_PVI_O_A]|nr:response regulator transcription factor [Microcoleus sp. PH2017_10_PVI_O_A]MCC3464406.1 response regulator transcription factor [Microcoleus sp. PH2017_11_PCY_U_A]MCC3482734.1 response regulator transcription factor [Microcoleus sp. PH2017_12_PCY_D_A]MCC3532561.1 response regulator transcription factor [Microcoleus sp. PH2017_21_RUC_O_A]MCC3544825.1 response regulator transcription factor [Microcoleus sp. PH2017_22_RUC_O_B]MCC3563710.1 response regulator transcription factor [Microcoleus sp
MMQLGLQHILNRQPHLTVVAQAVNGNEAVTAALQHQPDIVLMDIDLPGINGIAAAQQIRAALPHTRILMLTHYTNPTQVMAALSSGSHGYCVKGTNAEQLLLAIATVQEGGSYLDPKIADCVLQNLKTPLPDNCANDDIKLTEREMQVLQQLVEGKSNKQIAAQLGMSVHTAKGHVEMIIAKFEASDRTQAAVKALRLGLV